MMRHLACIMDGNRRWAQRQGWRAWYGHKEGLNAAERVMDFCLNSSIEYLSLYTFSLENFRRPEQEKNYLFGPLANDLLARVDQFIAKGIQIRFVGDRDYFPESLLPLCVQIEEQTAHLNTLKVNLLFCYGGRQEIVSGLKKIITKVQSGDLDINTIDEQVLARHLWMSDVPEPDLIVRTGGVKRLSNFLLYQAAYSELYFMDCLWPEISDDHLHKAVDHFVACQRNFGQ